MERERRIERIAENIVEIKMGQAFAMSKSIRMHHGERPELLGLGKERPESRIRQFLAIDVGQDLDALQFQLGHDVVEFANRNFRLLQCNDTEPDKTVGLAPAILHPRITEELRWGST